MWLNNKQPSEAYTFQLSMALAVIQTKRLELLLASCSLYVSKTQTYDWI